MTCKVSHLIREWLHNNDRTPGQLARGAQIADGTLSRIIHDHQRAGPKVREQLEKAMGLVPGTLEAIQAQTPLPLNGNEEPAAEANR